MIRFVVLLLVSAFLISCGDDVPGLAPVCRPDADGIEVGGDSETGTDACPPSRPPLRAAFWELNDGRTGLVGLPAALAAAGWETLRLPLNKAPDTLGVDVIVLGSFVSDDKRYPSYISEYAVALQRFLDLGGIILQFTQAAQVEARPAFLPPGLTATRTETDIAEVFAVLPQHPLVLGLADPDRPDHLVVLPSPTPPSGVPVRPACWNCPHDQTGFSVIAAGRRDGEFPALMEAASSSGLGRVVLAGLHLDKLTNRGGRYVVDSKVVAAANTFFLNLATYARLLKAGQLAPPTPSPAYVAPAPTIFEPGSTTIVALPDTQNYFYSSEGFDGPAIFRSQTAWTRASLPSLATAIVLNVGDIVQQNTDAEWMVASETFSMLPARSPLLLSTGNHDHGLNGGGVPRASKFDKYFPVSRFRAMPTFGGALETAENSYHLIQINGQPWIVMGLEWAPRDTTLQWARQVLATHSNRRAIVATHAYMYSDETRYDHRTRAESQAWNPHWYFGPSAEGALVNDGQEIWEELIAVSPNVRLVLSGHVAKEGLGRMISKNNAGIEVHQLAFNYQDYAMGGGGFLRLFEFLGDNKTVRARTYSPYSNTYLTDDQNQFELTIAP